MFSRRPERAQAGAAQPFLDLEAVRTMPEIAKVMKILLATAERHWTYARTWLYAELKDRGDTADQ